MHCLGECLAEFKLLNIFEIAVHSVIDITCTQNIHSVHMDNIYFFVAFYFGGFMEYGFPYYGNSNFIITKYILKRKSVKSVFIKDLGADQCRIVS